MSARLAMGASIKARDLVASNDERGRLAFNNGASFCFREAQRGVLGRLIR